MFGRLSRVRGSTKLYGLLVPLQIRIFLIQCINGFLAQCLNKMAALTLFYFFDVFCPRLYRLLNFIGIVDVWSSRLSGLPAENLDGFEMFWMCRITAFCVSRNVPYQQEQGDFAFARVVDRESYWLWLERAWLPNVLRHHMVSFIRELDPDQDSDLHCFTFICIYIHAIDQWCPTLLTSDLFPSFLRGTNHWE